MESEILPRYFNHSSFASLRRQLNYFSFSRIGKDSQQAATYLNQQVVDVHDILTLRRRSVGANVDNSSQRKKQVMDEQPRALSTNRPVQIPRKTEPSPSVAPSKNSKRISKGFINSTIPVIHIHRSKKPRIHPDGVESQTSHDVGSRPPMQNSSNKDGTALEKSILHVLSSPLASFLLPGTVFHSVSNNSLVLPENKDSEFSMVQRQAKDADVLDGCQALLALGSE